MSWIAGDWIWREGARTAHEIFLGSAWLDIPSGFAYTHTLLKRLVLLI